MSTICPKCSSNLTQKTKFCKICGCNLQSELIETPTCPKCNAVYSSEIKFCTNDGVKLVHPDRLIPKCVICNKTYVNGAKFCPSDGGAIKLDDDLFRGAAQQNQNITNAYNSGPNQPYNAPKMEYNPLKIYRKAPLGKRFIAYLLDGIITLLLFIPALIVLFNYFVDLFSFTGMTGSISSSKLFFGLFLTLIPLTYSLLKDGLGEGQSFGKKAVDLMVINLATYKPCSKTNSLGRNLLFAIISAIPYIGFLVEVIMVIASNDGRKLSDLGAGTQVIEKNEYTN